MQPHHLKLCLFNFISLIKIYLNVILNKLKHILFHNLCIFIVVKKKDFKLITKTIFLLLITIFCKNIWKKFVIFPTCPIKSFFIPVEVTGLASNDNYVT